MEGRLVFKMGKEGLNVDRKEPLEVLSIAGWHISGLKQSFYFAHDSVGQGFGKSLTGQFIPDHVVSAGVWGGIHFQDAS